MLEVRFPVDVVKGVPVVTAPEEIDVTNAHRFRAALAKAAAGRPPALVVDMTRTRFCDSAGFRVVMDAHKQALAAGGAVLMAVPCPAIQRVLTITGIDQVIPHRASLDEALAQAIESADGQSRRLGRQHDLAGVLAGQDPAVGVGRLRERVRGVDPRHARDLGQHVHRTAALAAGQVGEPVGDQAADGSQQSVGAC